MGDKNLSVVYMGTPEFAVPALLAINEAYNLSAVVTVPDKPKGRGQKLMPSPVKETALNLGIPVLQPESLKDINFINELKSLNPDIIAVIAFRILPEEVYTIARIGTFNIHGSLLPKYRGAAPINHAIINGEKESGLTSFLLEKKVDTGQVILRKKVDIPCGFTAGDLHDLLMPVSAALALETIDLLMDGNFSSETQDESLACPAPKIFPEDCKIEFATDYLKLMNFIHGVSPVPGAWCNWNGQRLKMFRVKTANRKIAAGHFIVEKNEMIFGCGNGSLALTELQLQGKKTMKIKDFLSGWRGSMEGIFE